MKYFFDTEFIEGIHKPLFGKRRHFVDLISIGIVSEDGRKYEAISSEYRYRDASQWVKDNVIDKLYTSTVFGDSRLTCDVHDFHKYYGKTNDQIAQEIIAFVNPENDKFHRMPDLYREVHNTKIFSDGFDGLYDRAQPEFYAYYADYDWVVFCSLFGTMMNLPEGFPMYCRDLKQIIDERALFMSNKWPDKNPTPADALTYLKSHPKYPVNHHEHNAIDDAIWNMELYNFLKK